MRTIKIALLCVLSTVGIALVTSMSVPAHAQYYGGLPLNGVRGTLPTDANNLLFESRFFSAADALENGGTDLKFGYRFSSSLVPHLALVGQYADATRWGGQKLLFGPTQAAQRTNSYGLDLVGSLPLFDRLSITGNAGVARVRADSIFGGAAPIGLISSSADRYTSAARVGLGLQYDFNRSLGFRFGLERYRNLNGNSFAGNDLDGDTFSFGIRIRF